MPEAGDLDALVSLWQRARDEGRDPTAEELCAECPHMAVELQRRIDVLRRLEDWGRQRKVGDGTRHDGLADGPATFPQPEAPAPPAPILAEGPPGYELLGVLGRGGMGIVYRARQVGLNRVVALKMILGGSHAGAEERMRFLAEAEVVAALRHPGIVQVHDFGTFNGIPYFALEFCPGGSLEERLQGKPLPPAAAAELTHMLAEAVQHAHEAGIIHRDLKPGNILLRSRAPLSGTLTRPPFGGPPSDDAITQVWDFDPLVTDFGLARRIESQTGITRPGAVMGTPSYMSPEQGRGDAVGPPTDIYALGAMLYEMLTGRPPFQGATPQETLVQVAVLDPVAPRTLNPAVPRDLETICLKCLEKDARKRYPSCRELADDLARFRRGEPILARPVGPWGRLARWCRRNPTVASLVGAVIGVTVAALIAITVLWRDAASARDRAIAQEKLTQKERDAARDERNRAETLLYASQLALAQREIERGNLSLALRHLDACRWDLRGWEHRLLYTRIHQGQVRFEGHDGPVLAVAATADLVLTGGADRVARLWNGATGATRFDLRCPAAVAAVTLTPRYAVAGTEEGGLVVWDTRDGKQLASLNAHDGAVVGLAVLPGGRLVSAGRDQTVQIRGMPDLQSVRDLKGADENLTCLAASADGRYVAAGDQIGTLRVWEVATGKVKFTANAGPDRVWCVTFSPDARIVATGGHDKAVRLWDTSSGESVAILLGPRRHVPALAFSPDGTRLAAGGPDDVLRVWELPSRREMPSVELVAGGVGAAAWCPRGRRLWCGGADGTLRAVDPWGEMFPGPRHRGEVSAVAWSPEGVLTSAGWDSIVRVGHTALRGHDGEVAALVYAGGRLFTGGADGAIREWGEDGRPGKMLAAHEGGVNGLAAVPGGVLASCSADGTVRLWDMKSGQDVLKLHAGIELSAVACSPDGRLLAAAGTSGEVLVWRRERGELAHQLKAHTAGVRCLAFSPDGRLLASAGEDQSVVLWEVAEGRLARVLEGHTLPVNSLAWSADGSRLVSAGEDGQLSVWDHASGMRLLSVPAHKGTASCLAFGPGDVLASGGYDRTVRLWDARLGMSRLVLQRHPVPLVDLAAVEGGLLAGTDKAGQKVAWSATTGRLTEPPAEAEPAGPGPLEVGLTAQGEPRVIARAARAACARECAAALARMNDGPLWRLGRGLEAVRAGQWLAAAHHLRRIAD